MMEEEVKKFDWSLILVSLAIFTIGILNLYSATFNEYIGRGLRYWQSQLIWLGIGSALSLIVLFFHYKFLSRLAYPVYFLMLLLLVLVLVVGKQSLGARRWIGFGGFYLQPSEFMKLATVIALAKYFETERPTSGYRLRDIWLPTLLVMIPVGLIMLQPDLGTAMIILLTYGSMMLFIKIDRKSLLIIAIIAAITIPIVYKY